MAIIATRIPIGICEIFIQPKRPFSLAKYDDPIAVMAKTVKIRSSIIITSHCWEVAARGRTGREVRSFAWMTTAFAAKATGHEHDGKMPERAALGKMRTNPPLGPSRKTVF
jgi:hypothetical protein